MFPLHRFESVIGTERESHLVEDHFTLVQFEVPGTSEANSGDLIFATGDLNYK